MWTLFKSILFYITLSFFYYGCGPELDNIYDTGDIIPELTLDADINGTTLISNAVELSWSGNEFAFEFAWKLTPRDTAWSAWTSDTLLTYSYLDEGSYLLEIKSRYDTETEQFAADSIAFDVDALEGPGLRIYPLYTEVSLDSIFTIELYSEEVEELIGAEIIFEYDASMLTYISTDTGTLLANIDGQSILIKNHNEDEGQLILTLATALDEDEGLTGSGSLAIFTFEANKSGETEIDFQNATEFRDKDNDEIDINSLTKGVILIQ
tara:strand:+ start:323 stop:1120 length:798 start_codon:yes stop_codon:yes gene_type:complete